MKKIVVVGSGYVGMSIATLLSLKNNVTVLDIDNSRVDDINNNISPIHDPDIEKFLKTKSLNIHATTSIKEAYKGASLVIIATPTDYDAETNKFDTSSVDEVVKDALQHTNNCLIVIKSTIPVGHTKLLQKKFNSTLITFSPEFLVEGKALYDNLHPSRIIVGSKKNPLVKSYIDLMIDAAIKDNIKVIYMDPTEAESVKLFSNAYLAMRVSFFNELDTYALHHGLDVKSIIEGVSYDDRIGRGYNNPSFGYGGYCFPKDTKQLLANFEDTPQSLINAIVTSNDIRKSFISKKIIDLNPGTVGIYRLIMKTGSDNFRSSAIQDVMSDLIDANINVVIYEPNIRTKDFKGVFVESNLDRFKKASDIIIANRIDDMLKDVLTKVFTRDIFLEN